MAINKLRGVLLGVAALSLLGLGIIAIQSTNQTATEQASIVSMDCLSMLKGCGNALFRVHFDQPPKVMQPFIVRVEASQAKALHASFAMQGMEMGLNRYRLLRQADGSWQASVTLPVCVQGRSDWRMLLELRTSEGVQRYQLPFQAER